MKKIIDDPRTIYRCCRLYYEEAYGQKEIADILEISRTSVSKMLKKGRDMGIVHIEIKPPAFFEASDLEEHLALMFHLKEVVVVERQVLDSEEGFQLSFAKASVECITRYLYDGGYAGVSMGRTLYEVCHTCGEAPRKVDCTFVPLVGGFVSGSSSVNRLSSNRIAAFAAEFFGGQYAELFAPAFINDVQAKERIMKETMIQMLLRHYRKIRTVILGLGIPDGRDATVVRAGCITAAQLKELEKGGMAGDLSLQFFDGQGSTAQFAEFNEKIVGMPLSQLRKVENRIIIANKGAKQAEALYAAIRGGYANVVVLDRDCAERLMQWETEG